MQACSTFVTGKRRRVLAALVFAITATTLAPTVVGAQDGGRQRLVITDAKGDRGMLAPYLHHKDGPGYLYTTYVFDALVGQDDAGRPEPALASAWTMSADGLVFDIHLNARARWHDGQPVTAGDVAFTFDYMATHPYAFASIAGVAKAEVVAADHVRIHLKRPDASFLSSTLVALPILPQHVYSSETAPERFTDAQAAIGSGPYKLARYDKAQGRYLLDRNPDYYRATPKFEQVAIVQMAPEPSLEAMKAGEVDVVSNLPMDRLPQAEAAGAKVLTAPSNHPVRLTFNHRRRFADRAVRLAVAQALDRQTLVDIVYRGAAIVAETGYFQKDSSWGVETPAPAHDPEKSRALLRDAGWTTSADGRWTLDGNPVRLSLVTDKNFARLATVIAGQLESFGLPVDVRILETAALQDGLKSEDYDLALLASSTMGDPGGIARRVIGDAWSSDRFPDKTGEMKRLLDEQAVTTDPQARLSLLHRFQALYAEELPSLMLVNPIWATAYDDKVTPRFLPDGIAIGIPSGLHKSMFWR
jgi:peptide/nickel transport system substrate-binding protein